MALDYITKQDAEEKSGMKLDGRKRYFVWNGEVCTSEKYTSVCSGCSPDCEYTSVSVGAGCFECGYTGKRRQSCPMPVKYAKRSV